MNERPKRIFETLYGAGERTPFWIGQGSVSLYPLPDDGCRGELLTRGALKPQFGTRSCPSEYALRDFEHPPGAGGGAGVVSRPR